MDSKLIKKYFRGECSPQEVEEVLDWFESNKLNPKQEQDMYQFWQEAEIEKENSTFAQDSDKILAALNKKINRLENKTLKTNTPEKKTRALNTQKEQWKWVIKYAAAVLLPICFLWLFINYYSGGKKDSSRWITMETLPGTRKTIKLEDGSKILLNGGSKITYQQHFSTHTREITLSGEAFFEVAKDSLRPFIVRTGTLSTQALGTSFNINYQVKENSISVALATGAVKIAKEARDGNSHIARLKPGQQLVFNRTEKSYKVADYDSLDVLGWRQGVLHFKKANLKQVIKKLESLYGVDIELTGEVPGKEKEWHYTGTYYNESLDNVLKGIAFVKYFSYEKRDNNVTIKFN